MSHLRCHMFSELDLDVRVRMYGMVLTQYCLISFPFLFFAPVRSCETSLFILSSPIYPLFCIPCVPLIISTSVPYRKLHFSFAILITYHSYYTIPLLYLLYLPSISYYFTLLVTNYLPSRNRGTLR